MCNVKLSNGGGKVGVEVNLTDIPYNTAMWIIANANGAFRITEVIDNETGEVIYNRYVSDAYFEADTSIIEVIQVINRFIGEEEE